MSTVPPPPAADPFDFVAAKRRLRADESVRSLLEIESAFNRAGLPYSDDQLAAAAQIYAALVVADAQS